MSSYDIIKKNNNLTNYYYYENGFNDEEIKKIIDISTKYGLSDGNLNGEIDYSYRKNLVAWLPNNDETKFIYDRLVDLLKDSNDKMWNFNVTNLFESIQFTKYSFDSESTQQSHYDWHMDFGSTGLSSTRKLSCVVQLSDPNEYDGCDLELMLHRNIVKAPKKKGTIIYFPSYITHKVTPILKGIRYSLVIWFHGPSFV